MKYNPEKHHRHSIRIKDYDYTQPGWYFVTICVQDHQCVFGYVENRKMVLNPFGACVKNEWLKTGQIRDNVELDEYVVMPNHFHAVFRITAAGARRAVPLLRQTDAVPLLQNRAVPLQIHNHQNIEQFGKPVTGSVPTIIRSFKSSVTKKINELRQTPGAKLWQRNYWEHIVRNEYDLHRISTYIKNNPVNWNEDKFYN